MDYRLQHGTSARGTAQPGALDRTYEAAVPARPRLDSIDFLRGLVMVLMVLDHARDYLFGGGLNPRDVEQPLLFLTRWVTHFCAPIFVLLAGVSAYLYGTRNRSTHELARFLTTRGLWLIAMELTVVRLGWTFNLAYDFVFFQVIWAIGAAMLVLAALVYAPRWAIALFAATMIVGHHVLDGFSAERLGSAAWVWTFIHAPGELQIIAGSKWLAIYPLIPWVGVMAAGYALGPVMLRPDAVRRKTLLATGIAITIGFILLRMSNVYGDPVAWSPGTTALATLLSFVNCEKYPPSLLYLAMTLGPGLIALAMFRGASTRVSRAIVTIGRVPFLYYVAHIFILHAMAVVVSWLMLGEVAWLFEGMPLLVVPASYGLPLAGVYACWMIALLLLYPLCRWFAELKQRRRDWWLSYL